MSSDQPQDQPQDQPLDQEPAAGSQPIAPAAVSPLDWGIIGAAVLAFFFSLFSYYTISIAMNMPDVPGMPEIDTSASVGSLSQGGRPSPTMAR